MYKIKYLFLLSFVILRLNAFAKIDCVVVCDKNDRETIIPIKNASEITFDANLMTVGSEIFDMNLLNKYYFTDSENLGIQEISGDIPGLKIDPKGIISFNQDLGNDMIEVYNLTGVPQQFIRNGNAIDIQNLKPDVYIVKIGIASIKVVKR